MIEKYLIVGLFAALLIGLSYFSARRTRRYSDYNLAGRRLGLPRLVGTLGAAEFNTATLIGGASVAYLYGVVGLWYTSLIFIVVFSVYAFTVAKPYRRLEISTIAEFSRTPLRRTLRGAHTCRREFCHSDVHLDRPSTYLAGLAVITSVLLGVDPSSRSS